jgi:hypothetical protein
MAPEEKDHDDELDEYNKIIGQYQLNLNSLLQPLRMYGQGVYVDGVTEQLVNLSFQMYLKLSGIDIPYEVEDIHW